MLSLSSNWKKLQQTLSTSKDGDNSKSNTQNSSPRSPQKRKRDAADVPNGADSSVSASQNGQPFADVKRSKSITIRRSSTSHSLSRPKSFHNLAGAKALERDLNVNNETVTKGEGVSDSHIPGKYIALDCEMVGVGPIPNEVSQLARVSLVNWHGKQVYDSYVQPVLPVTDYRTHVSGIRPHQLRAESGARPFKEVRSDVAAFLRGRILVGHYLRSDLKVLSLNHPKQDIRDTSSYSKYREICTGGPKLKDLAQKVLGLDVQTGEHDSVEDARTAMLLYQKAKNEMDIDVSKRFGMSTIQQKHKPGPVKKKSKKKRRG